jgi:hypothetical protein
MYGKIKEPTFDSYGYSKKFSSFGGNVFKSKGDKLSLQIAFFVIE